MTYSSPDGLTPDTLPRPPESKRTGSQTLTSQPNYLRWIDYKIFLAMGLHSSAEKRPHEAQILLHHKKQKAKNMRQPLGRKMKEQNLQSGIARLHSRNS